MNLRDSSQVSDLSQSALQTSTAQHSGDGTPFKVPSFPSINKLTKSSDDRESSLQGVGESSPRLSQFFQPTQESPPHSAPHRDDPVVLVQPSPPPPQGSPYIPIAVLEEREKQKRAEAAAAKEERRRQEEDSWTLPPAHVRRKWAMEDQAHQIFESLRNVTVDFTRSSETQWDELMFGLKTKMDPDGVRRVIRPLGPAASERGMDSDDDFSERRRASTAPAKERRSVSTVISNSQPSNGQPEEISGSAPQQTEVNRSVSQQAEISGSGSHQGTGSGTNGTVIRETTLESTPNSRPQTAGTGVPSQQIVPWPESNEFTPLRMASHIEVPSSTQGIHRHAVQDTPIYARIPRRPVIQDSSESVPETSPVKEDVESEEFRTAQEFFNDNDMVDSSPVVVVPGRRRAQNAFVASSFPTTDTQRQRERAPKIQDDVSEEDTPKPPRKRQRMQSVESMDLGQSRVDSPSLTSISENEESHRVFARFNDAKGFYYPATVLEPPSILPTDQEASLDTKVPVIFDDGSETSVALRHIARLNLQQGDSIKVEMQGLKKALYIVQRCTLDPENPGIKDIQGNNMVIITKKSDRTDQEIKIPIDKVCLTASLFAKIQGRRYLFTKESLRVKYLPIMSRQLSTSPRYIRKGTSLIFQNMVFAISLRSSTETKEMLTRSIVGNSGHVVEDGFHEMFVSPQDVNGDLVLHSEWENTIFCAVIAEAYSRKAKYVQALALGVPCLSSRWIESCIKQVLPPIIPNHKQNRVVDWKSYLLPSGDAEGLGVKSMVIDPFITHEPLSSRLKRRYLPFLNGKVLIITSRNKKKETSAVYSLYKY
jgi:hypothetical protein